MLRYLVRRLQLVEERAFVYALSESLLGWLRRSCGEIGVICEEREGAFLVIAIGILRCHSWFGSEMVSSNQSQFSHDLETICAHDLKGFNSPNIA